MNNIKMATNAPVTDANVAETGVFLVSAMQHSYPRSEKKAYFRKKACRAVAGFEFLHRRVFPVIVLKSWQRHESK